MAAADILAELLTVDGAGSGLDADLLDGLDSLAFVKADGTVPLTANWDAGSFKVTAETLESDVATGTAPFTVASATVVANLNADTVDGIEGANFLRSDVDDNAAGVITFDVPPTSPTAGSGAQNEVIGALSGAAMTTGYYNTGIGQRALQDCQDGYENVAIGRQSLKELTSGYRNIGVGANSLQALTTGNGNIGIGSSALSSCTDGFNNMAVGYLSLYTIDSGDNNTAIGAEAMRYSTSAQYNVALGGLALTTNVTGSKNTAVGHNALRAYLGDDNLALGYEAMRFATTGAQNVAIGTTAMRTCTIGYQNVGIGSLVLYTLLDGHTNTAIGYNSMRYTTSGYNNVAIGFQSLLDNTTGYRNTALGRDALENNIGGYLNIGVGYDAGRTLTSGNSNTIIGSSADTTAGAVGSIALGTWATCTASNQMVVGSATVPITDIYLGEGVTSATPQDITINATGGTSGVDGADLILYGGRAGSGGAEGDVLIKAGAGTVCQITETSLTVSGNLLVSEDITLSGSSKLLDMNGNDIDNVGGAQVKIFHQAATPTANNDGDLWYETDTNIWWFSKTISATPYWLSCELFKWFDKYEAISGTTSLRFCPEDDQAVQYDLYIVDFVATLYVASVPTNVATDYWDVILNRVTAANSPTQIGATITTQNNTVANFAIEKKAIDTYLNLAGGGIDVSEITIVAQVGGGSPGVLYGSASATYRLVHL